MLNELAIVWLLVFSLTPPPATAQTSVGRVCQDRQAKRMQCASVSPQHGAPLGPQVREPPAQKQNQHSQPGPTWYRLPEPTLRNQQAGTQGRGFAPKPPLEQGYDQDSLHDKSDYGGHDYNGARVSGKLVRT